MGRPGSPHTDRTQRTLPTVLGNIDISFCLEQGCQVRNRIPAFLEGIDFDRVEIRQKRTFSGSLDRNFLKGNDFVLSNKAIGSKKGRNRSQKIIKG
jgi:hypothetical protein